MLRFQLIFGFLACYRKVKEARYLKSIVCALVAIAFAHHGIQPEYKYLLLGATIRSKLALHE
jgi:hypothetical protein